jgi:hypothetical protein
MKLKLWSIWVSSAPPPSAPLPPLPIHLICLCLARPSAISSLPPSEDEHQTDYCKENRHPKANSGAHGFSDSFMTI